MLLLLYGCGSSGEGSVYYLNFKAEQDEVWQQLAKEYTTKTGVEVAVVTAASGNYESTLMSEMGKSCAFLRYCYGACMRAVCAFAQKGR